MFTGLIEDVAELVALRRSGASAELCVKTQLPLAEIRAGDSIAVNGACLTVEHTDAGSGTVTFHTLAETLSRTNLGRLGTGAEVNLERALRLGDRLGGHLVAGHVDTVAPIQAIGRVADDISVTVALPDDLKVLVIPKGSIAISGVSLTIASLAADSFSVRIIPHTWDHTALRSARVGDTVNLEGDMVGKFVLRRAELAEHSAVTMDTLEQAGFL